MKLYTTCLQINNLCAAVNNTICVQRNKQLQIWIGLNETAIAFPTVTLEIPNDTEITQTGTEILLPREWNKALVLH